MHDISLLLQEYDSEEHERLQKSIYDIQSSLRSNGVSLDDLQSDHNQDVDRLILSEKASVQVAENHYHNMNDQLDTLANVSIGHKKVLYEHVYVILTLHNSFLTAQGRC